MALTLRTVAVEFLRAGPRHNQLLSPLTPYLAVCGDAPAGVVYVPYEQAMFERLRDELRYRVTSEDDLGRLRGVLDQAGRDVARMLSNVPGLPGVLSERHDASEILHLRIVVSASELAMIPFELSKVPVGSGATSDNWLALQAPAPVCMTRHNRSVRMDRVKWPAKPRILFLSGSDVSIDDHVSALKEALAPWIRDDTPLENWLTILENATLEEVRRASNNAAYTHVHVLAHGAAFDEGKRQGFGVSLKSGVISGRELSEALLSIKPEGINQPTVVTLATCESANEASVVNAPDVSVAHDLHEAGIPLVIASQFPLSMEGSVPFVREFYSDQLQGVHPLISLYRVRVILHACHSRRYHDWASLIVYEALPDNIEEQLHDLRYSQKRPVLDGAVKDLERAANGPLPLSPEAYKQYLARVTAAQLDLPSTGPYASEFIGLRAASWKRLAEIEYRLAKGSTGSEWERHAEACYSDLENSLADYRTAASAFLVNSDEPVHRKATLHWLVGQQLSMECILGRPFQSDLWTVAVYSAKTELRQPLPNARLWGCGTIAELYLLRLADETLSEKDAADAAAEAIDYATQLLAQNGMTSEQVQSTRRQFDRYVDWWSQPDFATILERFRVPPKLAWRRKNGLLETAQRVSEILSFLPASPAPVPATTSPVPPPALPPPSPLPPAPPSAPPPPPLLTPETNPTPLLSRGPSPDGGIFTIEMIPAENGDCLWIEYGDPQSPHRLVIDCGAPSASRILTQKVKDLNGVSHAFDLFVLTHIDADHISGVSPFFKQAGQDVTFAEIWFNGWKQLPRDLLSVKQGEDFAAFLSDPALLSTWNHSFTQNGAADPCPVMLADKGELTPVALAGGMKVTVLSPGRPQLEDLARNWLAGLREMYPDKKDEELLGRKVPPPPVTDFENFDVQALADKKTAGDKSVANGSSIALLLEFNGRAALLTGDAHAEIVAAAIRRLLEQRGTPGGKLRVDALKLSHHGSSNATTVDLLNVIDCPRYLVSSDGSKFYHPDRESIARVIRYGGDTPTLHFNYLSTLNSLWGNEVLQHRYRYRTAFPPKDQPGMKVEL